MEQAVVFGASMSGLLAARALSEHCSRVVIVERDELPTGPRTRRGVPQAEHIHVLLARGGQVLESLFPGLTDELIALGAPHVSMLHKSRFLFSGHQFARGDSDSRLIQASRATLEHVVRSRVAALPGVMMLDGCEATGLVVEDGKVIGARVTHLADHREERIDAELVVDAMGRGGRMKTWLSELGYDSPQEDRVKCDVTYVSRFLRIPDDCLGGDQMLLVGGIAGRPHLLGMARLEGERWVATAAGMAGVRPPTDEAGFLAFVETMPVPDAVKAIAAAEPLSDFVSHRYPASVWRRYERLRRFPRGLLAFGDALCSFNPIYGQGMTVASLQAEALRQCLRAGDTNVAPRFFRAAAKVIDAPWKLSAGGDLALPEIEGDRSLQVRLINRYVARVHRIAAQDPKVAVTFIRVAGLLEPPAAILTPAFMARVLLARPKSGA